MDMFSTTGNAAEGDWCALQETLHLLSIPGMAESIHQGLAVPLEDGVSLDKLNWS
jgi:antitoxin YefM